MDKQCYCYHDVLSLYFVCLFLKFICNFYILFFFWVHMFSPIQIHNTIIEFPYWCEPLSAGVRRLYREVVLLTEDRNLRVKAHARDVPVRDLLDFAQWAGVRWGQGSEGPAYACKNVLVRGYCSATVLGEFWSSRGTCIAKNRLYKLYLYFKFVVTKMY